nr:HAMP domain-containing sensor histidine kinase [uncultured Blautia sp.]
MELISRALEDLMNGKTLEITLPNQDTLPAKVQHQLLRLSDIIRGTQEKAQKERDQIKELIAETAHQLRNPLANMEGYLELLQEEELSREEKEIYLEALCASEARIRFLTEGFIKISRLENHVVQIKKEQGDLTATVLNSLLQVRKYAQEKQIIFSVQGEEGLCVSHDAKWLGEAVYNLLDNSVKYSQNGGKVEINISKNEMFAQIAVRDFGIGIEHEEMNLIFQRFYRGKRAEKQPGFGLGLYLAREIVLQHGGFMKAKEKEAGLEISIFLPV